MDIHTKVFFNYYPKGLNSDQPEYYQTKEHSAYKEIISIREVEWNNLLDTLSNQFGIENVLDRSDHEIGYRSVVYLHRTNLLFEIVINISKIAPIYTYSVKELEVDKKNIRTTLVSTYVNEWPLMLENDCKFILKSITIKFPYEIVDKSYHDQIIHDVSTINKPIGEATFFDVFFADTRI